MPLSCCSSLKSGTSRLAVAVVSILAVLGVADPASAGTDLYGVQPSTGKIVRVDPSSGEVLSSFAAPDALAAGDTSVGLSGAEEGASLIYTSSANSSVIYRLDPATGAVLSQERGFSTGGLSFQTGAAGQKFIYLLDGEFDIHRRTGFGGLEEFFWGPQPPGPRQAVGGDDQGREFAFYTDGQIGEYDPFTDNNTFLRTFAPPAPDVRGIAFDGLSLYVSTASGTLYTLDPDTGSVRATTTVSTGALFGLGAIVTAPNAPTNLSTAPDSPANNNAPRVTGTAEAGSTVELFTTDDCSGTPVATGSAADFASPGLAVSVADDSTTTFRATASNSAGTSACSAQSVTYREDSTPPASPSGLATDPASPANDNTPRVTGTAEANATVRLYTTSDCTGDPVATGSAAAFAAPGLSVSVADNSTTTFRATATDAAGGVSACSTSNVTFREDSTQPPEPEPEPGDTTRPRASVAGVRAVGCVRRAFSARVRVRDAGGIASVRVTRDARRLTTRRFTDRTKASFAVRIRVRGLRAGRHRLAVVTRDEAGNRRTVRRTFRVCAARRPPPPPRFTG